MNTYMRISLGLSTCPNDTFAFHGLLAKKVNLRGIDFDVRLLDVQELNELLSAGELDCSKASFHAALTLAGSYGVLRAGAAIGVGVGPLLLGREPNCQAAPEVRVICPGELTTATLLFRCFYPSLKNIEHRLFSSIMPALHRGDAELGVVIHEGRFTYAAEGLSLVCDLGDAWERSTSTPLPLGGILARTSLPTDVHEAVVAVIRDSLDYARRNRAEAFKTMARYAQELDDQVIWSHVDLYVNEHTMELGSDGAQGLQALERLARTVGAIAPGTPALQLLG